MKGLIAALMFLASVASAKDASSDQKVIYREHHIRFLSESQVSLAVADKIPGSDSQAVLSRKSPEISQLLLLDYRQIVNRRAFNGFYLSHDLQFQFDNSQYQKDPNLESVSGLLDLGYQTGRYFPGKDWKDSRFRFYIPFFLDYTSRMNSKYEPQYLNRLSLLHYEYNSQLILGTGLLFNLDIRNRKSFIRYQMDTGALIGFDTLPDNYHDNNYGVYFAFPLTAEFAFAPFNFINKKIDIWIGLKNRFRIEVQTLNTSILNRFELDLRWTGFDYLQIGYKPFILHFEADISSLLPELPYNQDQWIGMEFSLASKIRFFEIEVNYRPVLFSVYKTAYNEDPYKPHEIQIAIRFDLKNNP
jgi:hypothetical protein